MVNKESEEDSRGSLNVTSYLFSLPVTCTAQQTYFFDLFCLTSWNSSRNDMLGWHMNMDLSTLPSCKRIRIWMPLRATSTFAELDFGILRILCCFLTEFHSICKCPNHSCAEDTQQKFASAHWRRYSSYKVLISSDMMHWLLCWMVGLTAHRWLKRPTPKPYRTS